MMLGFKSSAIILNWTRFGYRRLVRGSRDGINKLATLNVASMIKCIISALAELCRFTVYQLPNGGRIVMHSWWSLKRRSCLEAARLKPVEKANSRRRKNRREYLRDFDLRGDFAGRDHFVNQKIVNRKMIQA